MTLRMALWARSAVAEPVEAALGDIAGIELSTARDKRDFIRALPAAQAAVLPIYLYDEEVAQALHAAPALRWLQFLTVGTDKLAKLPAPPTAIVCTAGDSMAPALAEHGMALMLALARGIPLSLQLQGRATWDQPQVQGAITCVEGRTMLIVGYGATGRELARRARAFGMRVVGVRRRAEPDADVDEMVPSTALAEALGQADVIVITAPLTQETRGLFGADMLARCRRGAWLINLARGPIVDSRALADALASGALGGAGLDVTDPEPLPPEHPLWQAPNLIVTPHVAGIGSNARVAAHVAENTRRFLRGEQLRAVHPPSRS